MPRAGRADLACHKSDINVFPLGATPRNEAGRRRERGKAITIRAALVARGADGERDQDQGTRARGAAITARTVGDRARARAVVGRVDGQPSSQEARTREAGRLGAGGPRGVLVRDAQRPLSRAASRDPGAASAADRRGRAGALGGRVAEHDRHRAPHGRRAGAGALERRDAARLRALRAIARGAARADGGRADLRREGHRGRAMRLVGRLLRLEAMGGGARYFRPVTQRIASFSGS